MHFDFVFDQLQLFLVDVVYVYYFAGEDLDWLVLFQRLNFLFQTSFADRTILSLAKLLIEVEEVSLDLFHV